MVSVVGAITGATAVAGAATALTGTSLASGLTSSTNAVTGTTTAGADVAKLNVKLPIANPLFTYASYNYVLGLGILTDNQLNNPDTGYIPSTAKVSMICKDAHSDPNNRVNTAYGKFDFYIDNLVINAFVANGPNINSISFDIIEPYSMGMFFLTCQTAAFQNGHLNWKDAPYLLTIDFRGVTETGSMVNVPNTTRKIPIKFQDITMRVTEKGSTYSCSAFAVNAAAFTDEYKKVKTDISIKGKTVQEVLQTGPKSLQAVLNQQYLELAKKGTIPVPDKILILFPKNPASAVAAAAATSAQPTATATVDTSVGADVTKKLGVTWNDKTKMFVQSADDCNPLGACVLDFSQTKTGDSASGKDDFVYNSDLKIYVRSKNIQNVSETDFKFSQDTDIINVINQVMLQSGYAEQSLKSNQVKDGFRTWWRIDTQVYNVTTEANYTATGVKPKLIVYRVLPADVHVSKVMSPNVKPPGLEVLAKEIVKEYNYIYTGKNTDIINFDIQYNASFATVMAASSFRASGDVKTAAAESDAKGAENAAKPLAAGNPPEKRPGVDVDKIKYVETYTSTDRKGGGGPDSQGVRAARVFHDAIHSLTDMVNISLTIIGDPYYITQSGSGNYTSVPSQYRNLNKDYTVNYQNGEVHIKINFRSPIDINQTTGMYTFSGITKTAPMLMFSGFYRLTGVESRFSGGKFQQVLTGNRVPGQERTKEATTDQLLNTSNSKPINYNMGDEGE